MWHFLDYFSTRWVTTAWNVEAQGCWPGCCNDRSENRLYCTWQLIIHQDNTKKKLKGNGSQSRTWHAVFVSSNNPVPVWSGIMCSRSVRRIINTHRIQMRDFATWWKKTEQFSKILTKEARRDWKYWAWNCFPPSWNAFIFIHQEEEKHQSIYQHLKSIVGNIYVDCLCFGFVTSAFMAGRNT